MLSNPGADRVKAVRSLARRAVRARQRLFVAEGPQAVREAVAHRADAVRDLYVAPSAAVRYATIVDDARAAGVVVHDVTDEVMRALTGDRPDSSDAGDSGGGGDATAVTSQGLLAVVRTVDVSLDDVLARGPRLLCLLAEVRDPGNAGTVLRAADGAGADAVVVTTGSVDVFSPKVVRSTAGSLFHLPVVTGLPVATVLASVRAAGLVVHAADGAGARVLREVDLRPPHAWLLGNEAWGLPLPLREQCDDVVRVPIYGRAESLNLAMAATLCLYASAEARHP